jgi:hypothetical protein
VPFLDDRTSETVVPPSSVRSNVLDGIHHDDHYTLPSVQLGVMTDETRAGTAPVLSVACWGARRFRIRHRESAC